MAYFPMYVDIEQKMCIVVGGGCVAAGKVTQLMEFGAAVTVIAPKVTQELQTMAQAEKIIWYPYAIPRFSGAVSGDENRKQLKEQEIVAMVQNSALVVAATNEPAVNQYMSDLCKTYQIPVNVVDEKALCTFFFPAIVKRDEVVVAVSTGGTSPALAAKLRRELETQIPKSYGEAANSLGACREYVKAKVADGKLRKRVFERLLLYALEKGVLSEELVEQVIEEIGNMKAEEHIRIGTRGSKLALAQADMLIARIQEIYPQITCEKVIIKTTGDKILDKPLQEFGGKAVFVTEFEDAILDGSIDCAVHSAKDMPMELADGLSVACVLPRADVRDVLITKKGTNLTAMERAIIGTGSLRRQTQIVKMYPNAVCKSLRGNVPTRLKKLEDGEYDGIILAAAGLARLHLDREEAYDYTYLDITDMVPAGGQAIIAVEARLSQVDSFWKHITDEKAELELKTERYILNKMGAGCHEAVGVLAEVTANAMLQIRLMKEWDGTIYRNEVSGMTAEWKSLAGQAVQQLYADMKSGMETMEQ